jgi:hypothetical protein
MATWSRYCRQAPSGDALIEQIRLLGELCDSGLLTPEELESKEADPLGRL